MVVSEPFSVCYSKVEICVSWTFLDLTQRGPGISFEGCSKLEELYIGDNGTHFHTVVDSLKSVPSNAPVKEIGILIHDLLPDLNLGQWTSMRDCLTSEGWYLEMRSLYVQSHITHIRCLIRISPNLAEKSKELHEFFEPVRWDGAVTVRVEHKMGTRCP